MLTEPPWQVLNCSWRESFVEFRVNFRKKDWKFGFDLGLSLNPSFWVGKFSSNNLEWEDTNNEWFTKLLEIQYTNKIRINSIKVMKKYDFDWENIYRFFRVVIAWLKNCSSIIVIKNDRL